MVVTVTGQVGRVKSSSLHLSTEEPAVAVWQVRLDDLMATGVHERTLLGLLALDRPPQKWEAHVQELQASPAAVRSPAVDALAAWAGVSWKARQAMKRAPPTCEAIEGQILAFLRVSALQGWLLTWLFGGGA
jgi:hypothetical protein